MRKETEKRFLELGFDTDLIQKIETKSLNLSSLKPMTKKALLGAGFNAVETDLIFSKTKRECYICRVAGSCIIEKRRSIINKF